MLLVCERERERERERFGSMCRKLMSFTFYSWRKQIAQHIQQKVFVFPIDFLINNIYIWFKFIFSLVKDIEISIG